MNTGIRTIVYPVKDIAQAKALFSTLLGVEPYTDSPYYVGFNIDGLDVGLDPNGHNEGMTPYFEVADIRQTLQSLLDAGAQLVEDVKNVGGGRLIASVKDVDGNLIGLLSDTGS